MGVKMDYRSKFIVAPGAKVRFSKIDASYTGKHETHEAALPEIQKHVERMDKLQYLLYADGSQSLLVVLQALDAAGKDGVIRHVFSGMNPDPPEDSPRLVDCVINDRQAGRCENQCRSATGGV